MSVLKNKKCKTILRILFPFILALSVYIKWTWLPPAIQWYDILNNEKVTAVTVHQQKRFGSLMVKRGASISNDKLDALLMKHYIDSTGMDPQNIDQKINLLLQVSSPDFWAKNYMFHRKASRMSGFVWGHRGYLDEIATVAALRDRDELKKRFPALAEMLSGHSGMEEDVMFTFMRANSKKFDAEDFVLIDGLTKDHLVIHALEDAILEDLSKELDGNDNECDVVSDKLIDLMNEWEKEVNVHFSKEDQYLVPLWLNMESTTYKEYHRSLIPKWYFWRHLVWSGGFIYRNQIRNTFGF